MTAQAAHVASHPELARLANRQLLREQGYVGGRWIAADRAEVFEVRDPASATLVAQVARLGASHAAQAIDAAQQAFAPWRALMPQDRAARLRQWHALILAAQDDLALLLTLEQGKPLPEARAEIAYAASFVEWYAEEGRRLNMEGVTSHLPGAEMLVRREPLDVAGVVTPWNFPSAMLTRKAAAALAAGCTEVGRLIAAQCAPTMKRLVMELGGHAPLLVFADADLDRAVEVAMAAKFATSGQDCLAANRILVERPIYAAFCKALAARVAGLRSGPGLTPGVEIGPLMHGRAVAKVAAQVQDALQRGARCLAGGGEPEGLFYPPTLLADVRGDAAIMHEETFGPVAAVAAFDTEAEAITRANATEYGLVAYVVTRDVGRALRLGRALDYGMVAVNRAGITGAPVPFSGVKQSGLGRDGARHGIEAFTDLKYVCLDLG